MYVLINGAFGVGKTSVAQELRRLVPKSVIFNPENVGFILQRLPGHHESDFQHLPAWRRLTVLGAKLVGSARSTVIVPMAFSEHRYLEEVRTGLSSRGRRVLHFCLTAPIAVVRERLAARGEPEDDVRWAWVHRRAAECCEVHARPEFGVHIPAHESTPRELATQLASRIANGGA